MYGGIDDFPRRPMQWEKYSMGQKDYPDQIIIWFITSSDE